MKVTVLEAERNIISAKGKDYSSEIFKGSFYCGQNKLTSLKGAPKEVNGNFNCSNNNLTTLENAPEKVSGGFYCNNNHLITLKGAPEKVKDFFV